MFYPLLLSMAATLLLLSACGQKGALYLPSSQPEAQQTEQLK